MPEKKILIVDDEKFIRRVLRDELQERYEVCEAICGEQASRMALEKQPDLIILDIEMPGISGIDLCRQLKETERTRHIPLMLLSSHDKKEDIIEGLQAGADDYLTKPMYLPELVARVDAHLRSKGYYAELEYNDLRMLLELSDAISASRNPMKILQCIVRKMAEIIDVVRCSIVGISQGQLVVKASNDLEKDGEIRLELDRYPEIGKALATRQAVVIDNIKNDPLMAPVRHLVSDLAFNSVIVVPIIKKQNVIGTFFLRTASNPEGGFSDRIYNLCHLVANISANALENATLFESMKTAQKFLEERAIRDGLTNLHTHRHFYDRLEEEFSRAIRYREPLSLIFCDIDDFKRINDTYGHVNGDEVLKEVGSAIRNLVRESDVAARYGGEEFAVLLPNTEIEGALEMTRRLMSIIRELRFECLQDERITISAGVSSFPASNVHSYDQLVRLADQAMYGAKSGGKDRISTVVDPSSI